MIHRFILETLLPGSASNAVANFLDTEHFTFHSILSRPSVLSETDRAACLRVDTTTWFWTTKTIHYLEYQPPCRFLQAVDTPAGPMRLTHDFKELGTGTPELRCEKTVRVELDLHPALWPFRRLIEAALRKFSAQVLAEDALILERRKRLFGSYIEDYLRDGQYLMCKEAFRSAFSRSAEAAAR
jgi:hypothetical protein